MAGMFAMLATAWSSVSQGHLPPPEVTKLLISKALGYAIIGGACVTKVPQILAISGSKSAEGLSALSFELEAVGLLIISAYGYLTQMPFSAYGEALVLWLQVLVILSLVYKYGKAPAIRVLCMTGLLAGGVAVVASGHVTTAQITSAFAANTVLFMAARVPQIYKNFSAGSTGQLSAATTVINVAGCVIRIFTTISENGGPAMLRQYVLSLVLNGVLLGQIVAYSGRKGNGKKAAGAKRETKKTK